MYIIKKLHIFHVSKKVFFVDIKFNNQDSPILGTHLTTLMLLFSLSVIIIVISHNPVGSIECYGAHICSSMNVL